MSAIRHIPSANYSSASSVPYVLRDGRQCASPHDLVQGMRFAADAARDEQNKVAVFGATAPSLIKLRALQHTLFEIALDKAFLLGCRGLSIGDHDLIADDSRVITTTASTCLRYSAWELAQFLGVSAGCGNGRGTGVYQYQYHSFYFAEQHQGVWNPATGERLRDAFALFGSTVQMHDFYATLYKPSEIRKNALERRTSLKANTCEAAPC